MRRKFNVAFAAFSAWNASNLCETARRDRCERIVADVKARGACVGWSSSLPDGGFPLNWMAGIKCGVMARPRRPHFLRCSACPRSSLTCPKEQLGVVEQDLTFAFYDDPTGRNLSLCCRCCCCRPNASNTWSRLRNSSKKDPRRISINRPETCPQEGFVPLLARRSSANWRTSVENWKDPTRTRK